MNAEQIKNGLYNLIVERLENRIPIYQYEYTQLAKEAIKYLINNEITVRGEVGDFSIDVIKLVADKFKNENPKKIKQFEWRFIRNVYMFTCATLLTNENIEITFRYATDFWTDSEILDIIDDVKVLNDIKNVWTNDKDTGFAQVPQEYRAAAIAGNYGAIIESKIDFVKEQRKREESAVAPKQPQRKQQYQINQEEIKTYKNYFTDEFVGNNGFSRYKRFIDDLTDATSKKLFATLLLQAKRNPNITTNEVREMSVVDWFRLWQSAFNIDKLQYKENQLDPDKLKDQTIYKYLFD